MAITFDHATHQINITSPQDTLSCQDLIDAIRIEEASERGVVYEQIATASGKESLGEGVSVGMTIELVSPWQVKFWAGNYIAKIAGGNLVGGIGGDPVAYSAGVQVLLVQSAASTIVTEGGSIPTAEDVSDAVWAAAVEAGMSASELMKVIAAVLAGKVSGAGTGVETFKGVDGVTDRVISTIDNDGNRTNVDLDAS